MMYGSSDAGAGMWIMMFGVFLVFLLIFGLVAFLGVLAVRRGPEQPVTPGPSGNRRAL